MAMKPPFDKSIGVHSESLSVSGSAHPPLPDGEALSPAVSWPVCEQSRRFNSGHLKAGVHF